MFRSRHMPKSEVCFHRRYVIPGGSAGHYHREGYTFDVGSSMMFGMGQEGTTNLITRALAAVGKRLDTVPDPTQIHYHLPASTAHPQVCCRTSQLSTASMTAVMRICPFSRA